MDNTSLVSRVSEQHVTEQKEPVHALKIAAEAVRDNNLTAQKVALVDKRQIDSPYPGIDLRC